MPNREKVIRHIMAEISIARTCKKDFASVDIDMLSDAYELLKEQEAKTVKSIQIDRSDKWGADLTGYCPSCNRPLKNQFNNRFCGNCGQAVKWDDRHRKGYQRCT